MPAGEAYYGVVYGSHVIHEAELDVDGMFLERQSGAKLGCVRCSWRGSSPRGDPMDMPWKIGGRRSNIHRFHPRSRSYTPTVDVQHLARSSRCCWIPPTMQPSVAYEALQEDLPTVPAVS